MATHRTACGAFLALTFLLGGCASPGDLLPGGRQEQPAWMRSPPADTAALYYGIGEGPDLDSAKRAALRDVAAKLRVSIRATTDTQVTVANDVADRFSRSRVSEEVRNTSFGKHQLEKSENHRNGVYALVSVDRQMLIAETRSRLDEKDRALRQGLGNARGLTGLERLRLASQLKPVAEDAADLLSLISSASPGFAREPYEKQVEAARDLLGKARQGLSFRLQYRQADRDVANLMRQLMSESELRIVEAGAAAGVVQITTDSHDQVIYGSTLVRLTLHVSLRSDKGGVFSQKEYTAEGSSASDRGVARQAALRKLSGDLKPRGAAAVLGLDGAP